MRLGKRALLLVLLVAASYLLRELRLVVFEQHRQSQSYEDLYYLPPASWLPPLSLGFQAALADLIWCRSLVYFGEELVHQGRVRHAFDYTDAVLALDPDFRSAYTWIGTAALYRPNEISYQDGLRATSYLKRAVERWPNDGELHWRYGAILRFELAPLLADGPERDALIDRATPHLATAASLGAGPAWLALNSSSLLQRMGKKEQAIRHLQEVYGTLQDEATRRRVEERLRELRSEAFVEALRTANAEFDAAHRRSYPYLSPGLFFLVGEPLRAQHAHWLAARFLAAVPTLDGTEADGADGQSD